jgi:hypothetical protein
VPHCADRAESLVVAEDSGSCWTTLDVGMVPKAATEATRNVILSE